jgi:hypothetical protein
VLKELVTLTSIRYRLKYLGFAKTIAYVARIVPQAADISHPRRDDIDAVVRRVKHAAPVFPGRAKCLEQSLTLYLLLRQRRIPVALCLGIRPARFEAHAWVEYEGTALGQYTEKMRQMIRIQVLPQ